MFKASLYTSMESSLIKFTCLDGIRYGPISLLRTCRTLRLMTIDVPQANPEQMLNVNIHFTVKTVDSFLLFVAAHDIAYFLGKFKPNDLAASTIEIFDELAQVANYLEYICPSEFFNWGARFYAFFYAALIDIDVINDMLSENKEENIFVFIKKMPTTEERKNLIKNCILWSDLHKLCAWLLQVSSRVDKLVVDKKQSNDLRNEIIVCSTKFKDEATNATNLHKIKSVRYHLLFRTGIFHPRNIACIKDRNLPKAMEYLKDIQNKIDISKLNNIGYSNEVYKIVKDLEPTFNLLLDNKRSVVIS